MIAIFEFSIFEALYGKELETFRKVTAQHHGKLRHITRRADLATIRQTRRVCEGSACHVELARSGGHDLGKPGFRAIQLFRHYRIGVIRRLGYQGADYFANRNCLVFFEAKLRRRVSGRAFGYRQFRVERQTFAPQRL